MFPGLWLEPGALLRRDFAAGLGVLQAGLASDEHDALGRKLAASPVQEMI